jgi:hypothetical protein
MYETLTGHPPLHGANFVQTAYKHMHEMPTPLQEVRPDLPAGVSEVITACLLKDVGERVQTMTLLRDALRELALPCSDSQQNTVGTIISQSSSLTNALKTAPQPRRINWPIVSAVIAIPILLATATGIFVFNATSRKPPQPPVVASPTSTNVQPVANIDTQTSSTVSVQSPVWKEDNPQAKTEVDVVAVYQAQPEIANQPNQTQTVTVEVHKKKEPITLVLFSYMPVHWNVKPFAGATIKNVIASGFHPQSVEGAGTECSVTSMCTKKDGANAFHTEMMKDGASDVEENREQIYAEIQQGVKKLLGPEAQIRHFEGQYYGTKFVLDSDSKN